MRRPLTSRASQTPHSSASSATPASPLPERPSLDQLRHRARDLLRGAKEGRPAAVRRLAGIGKGMTLAAAQLAIAREHGFSSWERLREEVARRLAAPATVPAEAPVAAAGGVPAAAPVAASEAGYVIRQVASLEELERVCGVIGAQITPPMAPDDRRFRELWPRFGADRQLMWLAADGDEIVGGALAFRPGGGAVTVRAIGLAEHARRQGVGRRLMAAIELEAMKLGAPGINLGADPGARGFYQRLGYAGRGAMMHTGLPLSARLAEARVRKLEAEAGKG